MKICSRCSKNKLLTEFRKQTRSKDGLTVWCKSCFAEYDRERYQSGDRARKEQNKANIETKRQIFIWNILLESKCKVCGEDDPLVLEFDHRDPETKAYNISEMLRLSEAKISEEVAKCDVLCANCHRRKTAQQFGFWRTAMPL